MVPTVPVRFLNVTGFSELGREWKALDAEVKQQYKDKHARLRQEMLASLSEEELDKRKVRLRIRVAVLPDPAKPDKYRYRICFYCNIGKK
jgi:hypothetical protein